MTKVTINDPEYKTSFEVVEGRGDIECCLTHIRRGYEQFLFLHTEDGKTVIINPARFACVEIECLIGDKNEIN